MKICSKCRKQRKLSSFTKKRGGLSSYCKFCYRNYCKNHYIKNKSYYRKRNYKYRGIVYNKLKKIKENIPCADCRLFYPSCVMDFDHIKRGSKSFNIGSAAYSNSKSWKKILEEIDKCELVCANCHRIRTYNRKRGLI